MKTRAISIDKSRYDYLDKGSLQDFVKELLGRNSDFMTEYRALLQTDFKKAQPLQDNIYRKYKVFVPVSIIPDNCINNPLPFLKLPVPVLPHRCIAEEAISEAQPYFARRQEAMWSDWEISRRVVNHTERPSINDAKSILDNLLGAVDNEGYYQCGDVLLLSVSLNHPKEYLLEEIQNILSAHNPRKEGNLQLTKWKYYLVAYDLRKQHGATFDTIGDALIEVYPQDKKRKHIFDAKNVENYYRSALSLIDGGYKKYI